MTTFFFVSGIILLAIGFLVVIVTNGDGGWGKVFTGFFLLLFASIMFIFTPSVKENAKVETILNSDSTQIIKDSLSELIFVISWKDEDGVWAGQNVKIRGRVDKNIGDTIIIKLPK